MIRTLQALSYGGGVQTTALAILNVTGRIDNPASVAIFADPGSENPGTYTHLAIMEPWLIERGLRLIRRAGTVQKRAAGMPLREYIERYSSVIPVLTAQGLGRRQCTVNWKLDVVKAVLRELGAGPKAPAVSQIGISYDEIWRMKDSPTEWVTNRFPLIELKLTRSDCRSIILDAGLPVPPKSACYFCPLQSNEQWRWLAAERPEYFEDAAQLEDLISARHRNGPAYLSSKRIPLRQAFSPAQLILPMAEDQRDGFDCGGSCGV